MIRMFNEDCMTAKPILDTWEIPEEVFMSLPWSERISMLSINPDAATREDIAKLAAELMEARHELLRLSEIVSDEDSSIILSLFFDT